MKTILFNPFQNYTEKQLTIVGVLTAMVAGILAVLLNGRFDGVLDLHFVPKTSALHSASDIAIAIITLTLLLFIFGKIINKKTRFIDLLAASLIAKIPFYFLLLFNINNKMFLVTEKLVNMVSKNKTIAIEAADMTLIVCSGIATFICLIWSIVLLFNGFKTATNSKETKHIILFIVAIILAEILSKILIFKLN